MLEMTRDNATRRRVPAVGWERGLVPARVLQHSGVRKYQREILMLSRSQMRGVENDFEKWNLSLSIHPS